MRNVLSSLNVPRIPAAVFAWGGGFLLAFCLWYLLVGGQMDLLCALLLGGGLLLVTLRNRASGAILALGYLIIMGDLRRMVAASFGQPRLDLLLLVGPTVAIVLALPMLLRLRFKERLSKAMFGLLVIMILEMFNPQQGGLAVGASGALFYIVPVLWFWVGRHFASPNVVERLLYRCVFPLALLAAIMGLCQTFIGFLPYQQAWIDLVAKNYTSLHVGNSIRAFGFSTSSAEYATLLTFGAVGTAAAYFGSRRLWAFAVPVFVATVVIASSRGLVIKLIFTFAVVWTLRQGRKLDTVAFIRLGILTAIGLAGVSGLASRFAPSGNGGGPVAKESAVQNALQHQASGLAHPLDQKYSTAGVHGKQILSGISQGFTDPIGRGLGSTTTAFRKFGGEYNTGSSEQDFSDTFISLGFMGGFLYLFIIFETARYALRYVRRGPKATSLPTLAILVSSLGAWLIGGMYSTSSLVFFLIGAIVYADSRAPLEAPEVAPGRSRQLESPIAVPVA